MSSVDIHEYAEPSAAAHVAVMEMWERELAAARKRVPGKRATKKRRASAGVKAQLRRAA
jgi:hypothetical protein